jgi:hypothetical protein
VRHLGTHGVRTGTLGVLLAGATCALLSLGAPAVADPAAHAARTITLNDTAHLRRTSSHGFNLYESGQASGSLGGALSLHLVITSLKRVTASLTVRPSGGVVYGSASGSYSNNGATASFSGTLDITGGSGSYSGAHGGGLSFSGTIARINDAATVRVSGHFSS